MTRLRPMLRKELLQFRRNPMLLRMAILMPLMQTLLLSYAANLDVVRVPVAVWDEDAGQRSRELVAAIDATTAFRVVGRRLSPDGLQRALDTGEAALVLHIPPDFSAELERGEAVVQVLVDGSDASATVASGYIESMVAAFGARVAREQIARRGGAGSLPRVEPRPRVFFNPDLRSLWFMAPAVMAMVLTVLMQNLTALSIARERELGTLEQLVMTPIRPAELLLGKLIPYGLVGAVDAAVITSIVVFGFGVPLRGSVPFLALAVVLFLFATLGLGLLVSTVAANQQQAQLVNFFLTFPTFLISGFIFPVANLPDPLRWASHAVPMTYMLAIIRGVFLRGSGFAAMWPNLLGLAALAVLFFGLGALRFRKRLE